MEGECLLQRIKTNFEVDLLLQDLETYLAPVLHRKSSPTQEVSTKYGLYAMKMLRACVQQLTVLRKGSATVTGIILMANRSYECIQRTVKHTKTVPLSLEKLLFHMMVQSMAKELIADSMVFARSLYEHLNLCRCDFVTHHGVDNEYDTVCKQAFNQLWKGCVDLENSSKQGTRKHMVVLDVRLQALTFLMLTSYEVSWVVERALRAVAEFDRVNDSSHSEESAQVVGFLEDILDTLHSNFGDGKKKEDLQEEQAPELLSSLFEISLQFAKRCCQFHKHEAALNSCEKLHKLIISMPNKNYLKLYSAAADAVTISVHMRKWPLSTETSKNTQRSKSKAKKQAELTKEKIQVMVSCVSKIIEKGDLDFTAIKCLVEALEFFKKPIECIASQQQEASQCSFKDIVPENLVESVNAVLNLLVDLLQLQREHLQSTCSISKETSARSGKQHRLLLQRAVNRQLALLNLMSSMVLHQMNLLEDNMDAIKKLTDNALSLCQRTQCIIQEVSCGAGGSLSTSEHRWLGTSAYNLGLVCYRKKWYLEAVPLLNIACEQLHQWCLSDKEKITKVQLLSKYELLVDTQRKANQNRTAMQTAVNYLWAHVDHLTDQLTTPVELWVKSKRDAVKVDEDEQLRTRTLFDAIQEIEGTLSNDSTRLVSKLLEQELGIYKAQRYDTTVEQYSTVCDLLSLYGDDTMTLHRAHTHIEQAQLLRDGTLDTDCCPVDCCKEAIILLEELAQALEQQQQQQRHVNTSNKDCLVVFDLLATAYFWLYICESEANQATYVTSQFNTQQIPEDSTKASSTKKDKPSTYLASLSSYTLAAELSAVEPLDRALDIWTDLMADGCNQSMFNDPASTCYCLKVAASLCELADRPIQQVQALTLLVLLSTATSSTEDVISAYCQSIRALCHLGMASEAEQLLAQAQLLLEEAKTRAKDWTGVEATFVITKCYMMLGCHKIREFETLLDKVLQQYSHKRRSRQMYLRNASIKHLQSLYLLLPASERLQAASVHLALIPDDTSSSSELRVESMRLQMGVGRLMFSEGVFSNELGLQGDGFKLAALGNESGCNDIEFNQWTVMACVLQSLYDVGSLYIEQGCVREAKSYLKEGLTLADKFMLPRRCAAFLLQLSNLHSQCNQRDDCRASLAKVQQILYLPEKVSQTRPQEASTDSRDMKDGHSRALSEIHKEEDEDDFIRTKRISISAECSLSKRFPRDSATSSPTLRPPTVKLPGFYNHSAHCACVLCSDVSLHSQELQLILRTAQCLEFQGDTSQALTHLEAALDLGGWSADKVPTLLCKSCMSLKSTGTATRGKEKVRNAESSRQRPCDIHSETVSEIHTSLARLNLQKSCQSEADKIISLELPSLKCIPKAWLHFYKILTSLDLHAEREGTTVRHLLSAAWHMQSSSKNNTVKQIQDEELASQFSQLDLGKPSKKQHIQFQDSVFASRMQRPEVSRKFSDKMSDVGIFCDISDSDESDEVVIVGETSTKNRGKSKKLIKVTPKHVELSSKKGSLLRVKKKMPTKKIWEDNVTPVLNQASTSVFDFDEPSPVMTKKTGTRGRSGRGAKTTGRRKMNVVDVDSEIDEVFDDEKETKSKTPARSKRTTDKKSEVLDADANADAEQANPQESHMAKSVQKSTKSTTTKAKKSKRTEVVETPLPQPNTTSTRPKRGRKPNTENLRSEIDTRSSDDLLNDLFSTSFDLESPIKSNSPSPISPNHNIQNLNFEVNTSLESPRSRTTKTLGSISKNTSLFILEDLEEIEIPRAGQDSDSEDSKSTLTVLQKRTRKPVSKQKTSKKVTMEETEVLRGTKHTPPIDVQPIKEKTGLTFATVGPGKVGKSIASKSATSLDNVILDLEWVCSQLHHRAPALLYRRVCHLLAMSYGDREPTKAAYYLSEATAVTLRHHKLSSLTKKIKKVKKEMDSDSIQQLSDILASASLDERSSRCDSSLHHLANEKVRFTFSRGSGEKNYPNVVQQTQDALPDGWSVCIISIVSSSISSAAEMTDADSLLLCRLSRGCEPVIVNQDIGPEAARLLMEFNSILTESKQSVKETDKKTWWTCRQQLDQRMQALTEAMEETFLGPWKGLLLGSRRTKEKRQAMCQASEKLRSLVESTCKKQVDLQLCQCLLESFNQLSKCHLNSALSSLTGLLPSSEKHSSLVLSIKRLIKGMEPATSRGPVILILDKQLQHLPWETMPILRDFPVCRMPSLYFILSHLKMQDSSSFASPQGVDPSNAFFVLNPSNDLANTQKTFQKWFQRDNGWKGVVARPPTKEEYQAALTDHQLFVYCGHGNGREFLTGDDIQRLTCQATSLLMGCSSGRLHVTGMQEASGMVLNYLVAECPCIVANLWDVTDRDIDRFLEQLLRSWLTEGGSLLDYMAKARQACKLQFLIGSSPVLYGLPVCLKDKLSTATV